MRVLLLLALLCLACSGEEPTPASSPTASLATPEHPTAIPATQVTAPMATPAPSGRVTLNAVGDLMLARDIITLMDANGSVHPFAAVRGLLADADLTIGNMEGTFTDHGTAAQKTYTFRTPPRHAKGLAEAGIDLVSLGNNHAMDFGVEGLVDTLAALDAVGVLHGGAGANEAEARRPVVLERNGLRLAFLSYDGVLPGQSTPAGPSSPGVAFATPDVISEDVTAAREDSDLVIVSLHVGEEYVDPPAADQRALATAAIDAGAALVLGHHAHVLQGWQRYGAGVIVWGLGNFVFDLDLEDLATLGPRPFQTVILGFELTREGVQDVVAYPVYIDPEQNRPVIAEGEEKAAIEERIRRLNAVLP